MTRRRRFLVTYDITDDRRRTRVHKAMLDHGDRVQYSVFLCELDERERVRLRARIEPLIDHRLDQVLSLDLGSAEQDPDLIISSMGRDFSYPVRAVVV